MERNHVVIDLDTFIKLQHNTEKLKELENNSIILSKDTFKLKTDYFNEKLYLTMDSNEVINIAQKLFSGSKFQKEFIENFSEIIKEKMFPIGEYEQIFKKIKSEDCETKEESEDEE